VVGTRPAQTTRARGPPGGNDGEIILRRAQYRPHGWPRGSRGTSSNAPTSRHQARVFLRGGSVSVGRVGRRGTDCARKIRGLTSPADSSQIHRQTQRRSEISVQAPTQQAAARIGGISRNEHGGPQAVEARVCPVTTTGCRSASSRWRPLACLQLRWLRRQQEDQEKRQLPPSDGEPPAAGLVWHAQGNRVGRSAHERVGNVERAGESPRRIRVGSLTRRVSIGELR